MPWTEKNYPDSMKYLTAPVRSKAIEIANAMLDEGMEEGIAIATGISRAKDWAANRGKKIRTKVGREEGSSSDLKAHGEDRYVVPYEGKWAVRTERKKKVDRYHYKKEAVQAARQDAKDAKANLIIQKKDGKIQRKVSYNPNKSR